MFMNINDAKAYMRNHPGQVLELDRVSRNGHSGPASYVCPFCGSGSGKNGTGITSKDGIHYTCWAGCFTNCDIIDIIGKREGATSFPEALRAAAAEYGIELDTAGTTPVSRPRPEDYPNEAIDALCQSQPPLPPLQGQDITPAEGAPAQVSTPAEPEDLSAFFAECAGNLSQCDYLTNRGISLATQKRFGIGYCEHWRSPAALAKGAQPPASPRIIIPTGPGSYIARDTRQEGDPGFVAKFAKQKHGTGSLYNLAALDAGRPVFVVEGEIDALSVEDIGHSALALGSTSNCGKLIKFLKEHRPNVPLLIALDNDEAGKKAARELLQGLGELRAECYQVQIAGRYKDPNEYLIHDREGFRQAVKMAERTREERIAKLSGTHRLDQFLGGLADTATTPFIPTGFEELDRVLDGGLYAGLYIIGAISSLGKTTFALQIADQIAAQGHDVMIFTLEMAANELIAKSISRHTAELLLEEGQGTERAKTLRDITVPWHRARLSAEDRELISIATAKYREYAGNLYYIEGIGDVDPETIQRQVLDFIGTTGRTPVVLIDYLQIIAPANEKATDKQNTDKAVLELKRLSRDIGIPVLAISSFNRANYSSAVSMEAFKESGAIEYSADVLIGLQLKGAGTAGFNVNGAKNMDPREIEAVILKNRNGATGITVPFAYRPKFNLYTPGGAAKAGGTYRTRRDALRDELRAAIDKHYSGAGALLIDVADALDKSTAEVQALILELGLNYTVNRGGLITLQAPEKARAAQTSKRERERQELIDVISEALGKDGTAPLQAVCDRLDLSPRKIQNKIADLGLNYTVTKDTITPAPKTTQGT
jgi:replicative DNA helicase